MCHFDYTAVAGSGKVGPVNQVNQTSLVAVVTPTDRPKSVRNRYIIELLCGVVCVVALPFWHFCWCRGFCHRTESDLFLFLVKNDTWDFNITAICAVSAWKAPVILQYLSFMPLVCAWVCAASGWLVITAVCEWTVSPLGSRSAASVTGVLRHGLLPLTKGLVVAKSR